MDKFNFKYYFVPSNIFREIGYKSINLLKQQGKTIRTIKVKILQI